MKTDIKCCNHCHSIDCIHCLVYEHCICYIPFITINAYFIQNLACYIVDSVHIILVVCPINIHNYRLQEKKWSCTSCERSCNLKLIFQNIPENLIPQVLRIIQPQRKSECISTTKIPFALSRTLPDVSKHQLVSDILIPDNLFPEKMLEHVHLALNMQKQI